MSSINNSTIDNQKPNDIPSAPIMPNPMLCAAFSNRQHPQSELYNMDCVQGMKHYPDKYFDLAVVDPPYGIDIADWDTKNDIPTILYFTELFRVSKNQIIWGGNYFDLPHTQNWICWDKTFKFRRNIKMSEFELAWSSFDTKSIFLRFTYCGNFYGFNNPKAHYDKLPTIHPTQKPTELYEWILSKFAEKGQRILDTHVGSGSSRIACYLNGFDFVGFEIDKQYCEASEKRFVNAISQQRLFT